MKLFYQLNLRQRIYIPPNGCLDEKHQHQTEESITIHSKAHDESEAWELDRTERIFGLKIFNLTFDIDDTIELSIWYHSTLGVGFALATQSARPPCVFVNSNRLAGSTTNIGPCASNELANIILSGNIRKPFDHFIFLESKYFIEYRKN